MAQAVDLARCPWRMVAAAATAQETYVACLPAEHRLYESDSEDLEGVTGVLLVPSTLSNDWAVALSTYSISEDGK